MRLRLLNHYRSLGHLLGNGSVRLARSCCGNIVPAFGPGDCASHLERLTAAADPGAIEAGLSQLFQQYFGSVRLTL